MARYEFLTTWCVDEPIERMFAVVRDSAAYPEWWKGVIAVEVLEPGDADGVGVWHLFDGPTGTAVLYSWNVSTTKPWMNRLGPLPRPAPPSAGTTTSSCARAAPGSRGAWAPHCS